MRVEDFARLDLDREDRTGIPEIVLAEGKSDAQLGAIVRAFATGAARVLVSRLDPARVHVLAGLAHEYHADARFAVVGDGDAPRRGGRVAIVAAGTADVRVAEEARLVAHELGADVETFYDVGVAGLHRLLDIVPDLRRADAVVVCAGREGALATVVGGLVSAPVIGVPVSVGYGHGAAGEAALSSMLQSCAPISVVNIDAGVVAGAQAAKIANLSAAASLRRAAAPMSRLVEPPIGSLQASEATPCDGVPAGTKSPGRQYSPSPTTAARPRLERN